MGRWGIGLGVVLLAGCGFVLTWGAPDDVAWVVLLPLDADGRAVEAGKLLTREALVSTPMDIEARVLALGYTAEAVAALGVEVPADATLVPTADPCAPKFPAPVWARRTEGDGSVPVDADPSVAPDLTGDWLPPRCAEGYLCVQGHCEPRVAEVAAGQDHACARLADGKVACWGDNYSMQTGVAGGWSVTRAVVVQGLEGVVQLGVGGYHTCARRVGGWVFCWGLNQHGELGDGSQEWSRRAPGFVPGVEAALDLAAGQYHTCVLLAPDDVRCWGLNQYGQLGYGSQVPGTMLVRVEDLAGVQRLAAGARHTCALQEGGAVTCWGTGFLDPLLPTVRILGLVRALDQGAVAVAAGAYHTCVLIAGGEVRCWGDDSVGQLGGGSPQLLAPAVALAAGGDSSCAVLEDGRVQCWGDNAYGQLGINPPLLSSDRPALTAFAAGLTGLALGYRAGCGLDADLRVRCWGWNDSGQLGNGTLESQPTPREVLAAELVSLTAGDEHTCALDRSGRVQCWGRNAWGQTGASYTSVTEGPQTVAGLPTVVELGAGREHTCARTDDGRVWCWGSGNSGQLGVQLELSPEPQVVPGLSGASSLAVGRDHGCVVEGGPGQVWCWGGNDHGQLGVVGEDSVDPVAVPGLTDAIRVAAGGSRSCALRVGGTVRCWGLGGVRDLGVTEVAEVQLGGSYGCLRKQDGAVLCFGDNYSGQLGDGTRASHDDPAPVVDLPDAVSLSTGYAHACAVRADGSLWCWGDNEWNQQGDGTREDHLRPTAVQGLGGPVRNVACGARHTVVFEEPDRVEAWGWNAMGQLGRTPVGLGQPAGLVMGLP